MTLFAATFALALLQASPAPQSRPPLVVRPITCTAELRICEAGRTQLDLKLQDEMERADVQNYLTRVELAVTKQKLAATLKKCGEACAPTAPASTPPTAPR